MGVGGGGGVRGRRPCAAPCHSGTGGGRARGCAPQPPLGPAATHRPAGSAGSTLWVAGRQAWSYADASGCRRLRALVLGAKSRRVWHSGRGRCPITLFWKGASRFWRGAALCLPGRLDSCVVFLYSFAGRFVVRARRRSCTPCVSAKAPACGRGRGGAGGGLGLPARRDSLRVWCALALATRHAGVRVGVGTTWVGCGTEGTYFRRSRPPGRVAPPRWRGCCCGGWVGRRAPLGACVRAFSARTRVLAFRARGGSTGQGRGAGGQPAAWRVAASTPPVGARRSLSDRRGGRGARRFCGC